MIAELFLGLQLLDVLKQRDGIGASSTPLNPFGTNTGSGLQPTTPIDFGFGTPEEIKAAEDKLRISMEGLAGLGTFLDTRGIDLSGIGKDTFTTGFFDPDFQAGLRNLNFGFDK